MQQSYISLDPERAESMSAQQRSRMWSQRVAEATGGKAGNALGQQVALTTMVCTYTALRTRTGFTITPFGASKLPAVAGIFLCGLMGYGYGTSYAARVMGDNNSYYYLMSNRSAILAGEKAFDQVE